MLPISGLLSRGFPTSLFALTYQQDQLYKELFVISIELNWQMIEVHE